MMTVHSSDPAMTFELRPYQLSAVDKVRESILAGHRHPLLTLATGAGKSAIFGQIISFAVEKGSKCLFIVHRRNLVYQFQELLWKFFEIRAGIIMAGVEFEHGRDVYLTTIQTYRRRMNLEMAEFNPFVIDAKVVLVDEAHCSASPTFMHVLESYAEKVIIGTTATPCRADGTGLGVIYDDLIEVVSMQELVDAGHLASVRYFAAPMPDLSGVKTRMGDFEKKGLAEKTDVPKIVGDVVENWVKIAKGRKTIVFAVNVKHSIHLRDEFIKVGIPAAHLDAKSPDDEREYILNQLETGEITVVTNCALFQEGMDIPSISCCVMARPTKSLALWRQCAGRAMRPTSEHDDMLLLDHGGNVERLGFLTDEIQWTLDGKKKIKKKKKPEKKEKKPVICRSCMEVFEGADTCPTCGTKVKTFGKRVETCEADLKEVGKGKKPGMAEKRRWYAMAVRYAIDKGWNIGAAAHKYKENFGVWPRGMKHVLPIPPDAVFLAEMRLSAKKYYERKNKS